MKPGMSAETDSARSRPFIARTIRTLSPLIILGWLVLILYTTLASVNWDWTKAIPALETVGDERSVSLMPQDAPAVKAILRMGKDFNESNSDSSAMIVLEGKEPLGDDAHQYYAQLVRELRNDPEHVEHVQDLWGDRLTSSSVQSPDEKAAYVQLNLVGNQGTAQGDQSVAAVRDIVKRTAPSAPKDVETYVAGAAPLASDMQHAGNKSILKITAVTVVIIFTLLLILYRSVITVILLLIMVGVELAAARGIVAFLGHHDVFVLSTFAVNMLVFLSIAAGTDYGIFFFGRYQEARQAGQDRETAYYTTYRSVAPVVLASGVTIAGAILCLHFTRLPYFQTMGIPCAIGMLAAVAVAVTLVPAGIVVASRFGLLEPKRKLRVQRWRAIGTAVVRWPAPILVASLAVALVGLSTLPGYKTSYNDRLYISSDIPANQGFAAAQRHFSESRLTPDVLLIETDRDLRNPADFLVLNKVAKAIFKVRGVSRVQGITRPEGTPIANTSVPFLLSLQSAGQVQATRFQKKRIAEMQKQADDMAKMIATMQRTYGVMKKMSETTHRMTADTHEVQQITDDLRGSIALFDDFLRPIRNYFYWEKHCFDIPICWSIRSIFDALDGADALDDGLVELVKNMDKLDAIMPQLLVQFPQMIEVMQSMRTSVLTMYATMSGQFAQMDETTDDVMAMGEAFDASKNDDSFFLPPEVFKNPDFQRAMSSFLSPDGKTVRFIISHNGDPMSPEGIARIEQVRNAAEEALKGTPLVGGKVYIAGAASTAKDWKDGSTYDLLIAGIAAICLVFHHHAHHHPKFHRGPGDRRYRGALAGCVLRFVGAAVAVHPGSQPALDGAGDVGDHPAGGRFRLQLATGLPHEGGTGRRAEYGHHPRDGRYRKGGDIGRTGVRRHDGFDGRQRPADHRADRYHHWPGPAVRHPDRALVHDPVDRGAAGPVVLVATACAPAPAECAADTRWRGRAKCSAHRRTP
ncbi:MMPL family protein [Mycobacteroides abscessus MAB_030201_1075]|uniref:MMPL family protein n=1 Tax=Mycobacteroides abscessus MAB_030201_1075 TaxID=1335410 RepID=A0A829PVN5_9MYCO|nr:MMPL family protein [Mycobacteroides abscessus MAB_030201_1075]